MAFNEKACAIPKIWCGEKDVYPKGYQEDSYYYKVGTRHECLKQGIGAGTYTERKRNLPKTSLQQIKYIGEKHEENFVSAGVKTIDGLIKKVTGMAPSQIKPFLEGVLSKETTTTARKKKVVVDTRAYNSVLLYLYRHGVTNLPGCKKV